MNKKLFLISFLFFCTVCTHVLADTSITGESQINQCDEETYTISITNTTLDPITGIVVKNTMPATGFSYINNSGALTSPSCNLAPANPTVDVNILTWDIDALCDPDVTLNPGDAITITFSMETDCTATSGSDNVVVTYNEGGHQDAEHFIEVMPGAVTVKKDPSVINAFVGDDVTWTLTIENTGLGTIENVIVEDVLGSGLSYVSSNPAGNNAIATTTWDSNNIPQLALMNPGEIVTIQITATVIACECLDNEANASWGCSPAYTCFDTDVNGGTANGSVRRNVRSPLLAFTPPDITFTYCSNQETVTFPITNTGNGSSYDVELCVNLAPLTLVSVSSPATYAGGCFQIPDMAPGDTYNLEFTVSHDNWCASSPAGTLVWEPHYNDECVNPFLPPVTLSSYSTESNSTTGLSATKTGPSEVQIGDTVTYHIEVDYSGPTSCGLGPGTTGNITVTDTFPAAFTVNDADGGAVAGNTITWTYDPAANPHFEADIILQAPPITDCGACATTPSNDLHAEVVDCCGCTLTAGASVVTAIECEQFVDSNKEANPTTVQKCEPVTYTNTYNFANDGALAAVLLNDLNFIEQADNDQVYVQGTLNVTFNLGNITGCVGITDNTPTGGTLALDFSGCAGVSVQNSALIIQYQMEIPDASLPSPPCTDYSFFSWTTLDLGADLGDCLADGQIHETTQVTVAAPAMDLSLTGIPPVIEECAQYDIVLTTSRTSANATPYDATVRLNTDEYSIFTVTGYNFNGVADPTPPTQVDNAGYTEWDYADRFVNNGDNAQILLTVEKRCGGTSVLEAQVRYDDNCNDNGVTDGNCTATATANPSMMLSANLIIEKTPETYFALGNTAQWTIYITNAGTGAAYNVWVDDILGAGLTYNAATVDDMTGVLITPNQNHLGAAVNGVTIAIDEIPPGQRREITLTVNLVSCINLTNDVSTSWGCGGADCQAPVSDNAIVEIPDGFLVNTNEIPTPINACADVPIRIVLKNAGQIELFNLVSTQTLPAGMTYNAGSTQYRTRISGAWSPPTGPAPAYDPNFTNPPSEFEWATAQIPVLASILPNDIVEITYTARTDCDFTGGTVSIQTAYENSCSAAFTTAESGYSIVVQEPNLIVNKTRTNPPEGTPLDCSAQTVIWQITVTNDSDYDLPFVRVEDVLGGLFTYSASDGYYPGAGQSVYWEFVNFAENTTQTMTISATINGGDCNADLDNTVTAYAGCGTPDGNPATEPGTMADCPTCCIALPGFPTTHTSTREPNIGFFDITVNPTDFKTCDDDTELTFTIENSGATEARNVDFVITLPFGLSYNNGTAETTCDGVFTDPAPEPNIAGNQLTFYDIGNDANDLCDIVAGSETLVLAFSVRSECFTTAAINYELFYEDCCQDTQYSTSGSTPITASSPNLTITKTLVDSQVGCGEQQTWTITVTNTGDETAEVVRIEDTLGAWIDYIGSSPLAIPIPSLPTQTYGWEFNNLAPGAQRVFTITGALNPELFPNQNDCDPALRQNNVRAIWGCGTSGDAIDTNPNTTSDYVCAADVWSDAPVATLQMPYLEVTEINVICNMDGSITVSGVITNNGDGAANSVIVDIEMDAGGGFNVVADDLPVTPFNIPAGGTATYTFQTVPLPTGVVYTFRVIADPNNTVCECDENNNESAQAICPPPTLGIEKSNPQLTRNGNVIPNPTSVEPGDLIQYQVTVTNTGGSTAYNVFVTDVLPEPPPLFTYAPGSSAASWPLGSSTINPTGVGSGGDPLSWDWEVGVDRQAILAPGDVLTLTFDVSVGSDIVQGTIYTNTATTDGQDGSGTPLGPTTDTVDLPGAQQPALKVDKDITDIVRDGASIGPAGPAEPGDIIVYQYIIRNVGEGTAYQVDFVDTMITGLVYDTSLGDGTYEVDLPTVGPITLGIVDGASGVITADINAQIDGGGILTAIYRARVTSGVSQATELMNYAEATGIDGAGIEIPDSTPTVDEYDDDPDDPDADDTGNESIAVAIPGLSVNKEITDIIRNGTNIGPSGPVQPDDILVYRYIIRNVGTGTAYNVNFTDTLPSGLVYEITPPATDGSYIVSGGGASGTLNVPDGASTFTTTVNAEISGGENLTAIYYARVTDTVSSGSTLTNTAEAFGEDNLGTAIEDINPVINDTSDDDPDDPDADDTGQASIGAIGNDGAIGDTVWIDLDGDGVQDPGEAGIPGVTINLYDGDGNLIGTAVTDSDGKYLFDELPPGDYTVKVDVSTLPPDLAQTYDADGGLDSQSSLTLGPGEINLDQDFGYQPQTGTIGDTVWLDLDGDGVQDAGEPGIPGVTVYLYDGDGNLIGTTVTDANGNYLFTNLPPGVYTVAIDINTLPPGLRATYDLDGLLDYRTTITLGAGEINLNLDFGFTSDQIVEASDLTINKSVSPQTISPGKAVIYSVTISNSSDTDITDAQIKDDLPDGFTYISGSSVFNGSAAGDPSGDRNLTWDVDLKAGSTVTLQYKATTGSGLNEGVYDNVVTLLFRNYTGEEITVGPVSAPVSVLTGRADCCLAIEKEHVRRPKPPAIIPVDQDIYFITDMAMFATYEFDQLNRKLDSLLQSDQMLTKAEERLKTEYLRVTRKAVRYAHFNLGNFTMQSGQGVDMRHAPDIQAEAAQHNVAPQEVVPVRLNLLARRAGLKKAPQIQPLLLEYYGGAPYYAKNSEDADLTDPNGTGWRWSDDDIDKALTPSAWGLTLLRQSIALPGLLASSDPYQRFIGEVMQWQMNQKVKLIHDQLVSKGDPPEKIAYLPHEFKLEKTANTEKSATPVFAVQDASSHLFDQTAMLWGLTKMRGAFAQAGIKSASELDALIVIVWQTLETMHYDKALQTYYPVSKPAFQADAKAKEAEKADVPKSDVQPAQASDQRTAEPEENVLTAFDLMMTTLALDSLAANTGAPTLGIVAKKRLASQIRFLKNNMIEKDGGVYAGYDLSQKAPVSDVKDLLSQAAAIRMLLASEEISAWKALFGEKNFTTALKIHQFMEDKLWDDKYGIYRDNTHWRIQSMYTPLNVGAVIGALRELSLRLPEEKRLQVWNRISLFLTRVVGKAELQLEKDRDLADDESAALYVEDDVYSTGRLPIPTTRRRASDDSTMVKSKGNLAPVIIRKVTLNLIPQDVRKLKELVESSVTRADKEALENADFHTPVLFPALIKQKQFDTGPGMLASNELEKASQYLLKNAVITDNAYLFDPSRVWHFATVLDEIAYSNLLRLSFHFEQGVPLKFSETVAAMAKAQGISRENALADWLKQAATASGLKNKLDIAEPIFVEYKNGEPAQRKSLERGWNARVVDHVVSAAGLAQTMNSQIRFIKNHGSDKTETRRAAQRRYLARVMGLQIAARIKFIESAFDAARKQGYAYLPALAELVVDSYGLPLDIKFENPQSTLFSQISLLQALGNLIAMDKASASLIPDYGAVSQGARGLLNKVWKHVQKTYADDETQALIAQELTALDAGLVLVMLGEMYHKLPDDVAIRTALKNLLQRHTEFVMAEMIRPEGDVFLTYPASDDAAMNEDRLASFSAILLGLIRVADIGDQAAVTEKIMKLYNHLEEKLWDQRLGVYLSREEHSYLSGSKTTRIEYTDLDLGITVSALAEMLPLLSDPSVRHRTAKHLTEFGNRLLVRQNLTDEYQTMPERSDNNQKPDSKPVENMPADTPAKTWNVKSYDPEIVQGVQILLTDQNKSSVGYIYTYIIRVRNICPDQVTLRGPLYDLLVRDQLPEGMTYIPGSSALNGQNGFEPAQSGQNLIWKIAQLEDSEEAVITFKTLFDHPLRKGEYINKVDVTGWSGGEDDNRRGRCDYGDEDDLKIETGFGKIEGRVFIDRDENGLINTTEKAVAGIRFKLDGVKYATTDKGGVFVFDNLEPGFYRINADWSSVDRELLATTDFITTARVKKRTTTRLKFGFNQYKQVFTQVYDDLNKNGKRDAGEPGVHAVRVNIRDTDYYAYSAEDGHIRIDRVPVGVREDLVISDQQPYWLKAQGQKLQLGPWKSEQAQKEAQ